MRAADDRGRPAPSSWARTLTSVLRHPWTMAAKGLAKDAVWLAKGRRIENPALPATVTSVLFVCLGNICRSPFAEHIAARRFSEIGATTTCASAGITARQSGRVPPHGRDVATTDYGISLERHEPRRLTREMVDAFDLVVVMEAGQLLLLRATYPHATHRFVLLSLLDPAPVSPHQRYHIDDPFDQPRSQFAASFSRIDRAVSRLVEQLAASRP